VVFDLEVPFCTADYSPAPSAKVKIYGSIRPFTYTSPGHNAILVKHREDFTVFVVDSCLPSHELV
jgi:hypothetical protein